MIASRGTASTGSGAARRVADGDPRLAEQADAQDVLAVVDRDPRDHRLRLRVDLGRDELDRRVEAGGRGTRWARPRPPRRRGIFASRCSNRRATNHARSRLTIVAESAPASPAGPAPRCAASRGRRSARAAGTPSRCPSTPGRAPAAAAAWPPAPPPRARSPRRARPPAPAATPCCARPAPAGASRLVRADVVRACNDARSARKLPRLGARTVASTWPSFTGSPSRNTTSSTIPPTFAGTWAVRPGSASMCPVANSTGATTCVPAPARSGSLRLRHHSRRQLDPPRQRVVLVADLSSCSSRAPRAPRAPAPGSVRPRPARAARRAAPASSDIASHPPHRLRLLLRQQILTTRASSTEPSASARRASMWAARYSSNALLQHHRVADRHPPVAISCASASGVGLRALQACRPRTALGSALRASTSPQRATLDLRLHHPAPAFDLRLGPARASTLHTQRCSPLYVRPSGAGSTIETPARRPAPARRTRRAGRTAPRSGSARAARRNTSTWRRNTSRSAFASSISARFVAPTSAAPTSSCGASGIQLALDLGPAPSRPSSPASTARAAATRRSASICCRRTRTDVATTTSALRPEPSPVRSLVRARSWSIRGPGDPADHRLLLARRDPLEVRRQRRRRRRGGSALPVRLRHLGVGHRHPPAPLARDLELLRNSPVHVDVALAVPQARRPAVTSTCGLLGSSVRAPSATPPPRAPPRPRGCSGARPARKRPPRRVRAALAAGRGRRRGQQGCGEQRGEERHLASITDPLRGEPRHGLRRRG